MTLILNNNNKPLTLYIPLVNIPHELCYSRGQREKLVEFSATFHSRYLSFQMIRIPHVSQPQAVLLPSFSLWHRRPVFGKWLPLALPFGKSSFQSQQISELIHLEKKKYVSTVKKAEKGKTNPKMQILKNLKCKFIALHGLHGQKTVPKAGSNLEL